MPWMYPRLKPKDRVWAKKWQSDIHAGLMEWEAVEIASDAFIAPSARIFAEPGRIITIGAKACIGHDALIHGPVTIGPEVTINPRVSLDGGKAGIVLGKGTRVATGVMMFAFDHGLAAGAPIRSQPVTSRGITVGADVWIGAGAGITDGVTLGDGAVVGMGAVVCHNVAPGTIVAGVPARPIGRRSEVK